MVCCVVSKQLVWQTSELLLLMLDQMKISKGTELHLGGVLISVHSCDSYFGLLAHVHLLFFFAHLWALTDQVVATEVSCLCIIFGPCESMSQT